MSCEPDPQAAAEAVRARVGVTLNWQLLQVFLGYPDCELTVHGLGGLERRGYRRNALNWALRALQRRGVLQSRRSVLGHRHYWLTDDAKIRAQRQLCRGYPGAD
jgi:hypothetical protein